MAGASHDGLGGAHWRAVPAGLVALALVPLALLVVPLAALVLRSFSLSQWGQALGDPVVREALRLSALTTGLSLVLVTLVGTPVAYMLARYRFPGFWIVDAAIDLPMVLPPAVAGLALLMAFGRKGILAPALELIHVDLAFTTTAVVLAQCFVAVPFYVRAARAGFEAVDPQLEHVAATLGEPPLAIFRRVTLPLAFPSLLAGAVMAWARALGEFGATIMFAGNLPGRTQTMPLAIYTAMEGDVGDALTLACILLGVSFAALFLLRRATKDHRGAFHAT